MNNENKLILGCICGVAAALCFFMGKEIPGSAFLIVGGMYFATLNAHEK